MPIHIAHMSNRLSADALAANAARASAGMLLTQDSGMLRSPTTRVYWKMSDDISVCVKAGRSSEAGRNLTGKHRRQFHLFFPQ